MNRSILDRHFARALLQRTLGVLALAALVVFVVDARYLFDAKSFNQALATRDFARAGQNPSAYGVFADAFRLQRGEQFEEAIDAYERVEQSGEQALLGAVKYNLGNLYLNRAHTVSQSEDADLSVALIELAKESYREALRLNSDDWPAKHNLARALEVLPEAEPLVDDAERMPERSPRAPQAARAYERLP